MSIDFGEKRVGIASTDESGAFALPRAVWPNDAHLEKKVLDFARENEIERVVVGESRNLDGAPNPILTHAKAFAEKLSAEGFDVVFHPEVLTTREARQIQGNTAMTDASAASLILKNYIDSLS